MKSYPKLRYPIATNCLTNEERLILLAYDIIWRMKYTAHGLSGYDDMYTVDDIDANLSNLGHYIEHNLCAMDMALRFEGYDNSSPEDQKTFDKPMEYDGKSKSDMIKEFTDTVNEELKQLPK